MSRRPNLRRQRLDLLSVRNKLGCDPESDEEAEDADINGHDKVNILDLLGVRNQLGQRDDSEEALTCPPQVRLRTTTNR